MDEKDFEEMEQDDIGFSESISENVDAAITVASPDGGKIQKLTGSRRDTIFKILCYVFCIIWLFILLFPLYWLIVSSTKDNMEAQSNPPAFWFVAKQDYAIELNTEGLEDYTDERFMYEAAVICYMVAAQSGTMPIRGYNFSVVRVENGIVIDSVETNLYSLRAAVSGGEITQNATGLYQSEIDRWYNVDTNTFNEIYDMSTGTYSAELAESKYKAALSYLTRGVYTQGEEYAPLKDESSEGVVYISNYLMQATEPDPLFPEAGISIQGTIGNVSSKSDVGGLFINFKRAWEGFSSLGTTMLTFFTNSFVVAVAEIAIQCLFVAAAAYALSQLLKKKIANYFVTGLAVTIMIPGIANLVPMYTFFLKNNMDNLWAVILPASSNCVFTILFKSYFDSLPKELREAAVVDGASEITIFFRLVIPLSTAMFGVLIINTFISSWNNFFWPNMILLRHEQLWTLPIAMQQALARGAINNDYSVSLPMSLIVALPTFFLFAFFQKQMTKGLVFTGLKG